MELLKTINFLDLDDGQLITFYVDWFSSKRYFTVAEVRKYFKDLSVFVEKVQVEVDSDNDLSLEFIISKEDFEKIREYSR